jgi:hypothetical protein
MSNGRQAAEQAARAYLDGIAGDQGALAQAVGLVRAWTLARSVGSTALALDCVALMIDIVFDLLDRDEHPYAVIPLLCALVATPSADVDKAAEARIDDGLDRALVAYPQRHATKDLVAIVRKRAVDDAPRVDAANRRLVEAMLADARAAVDPMVIRALFHEAASTARQLGLLDLEKVAAVGLQSAPALDWSSTPYEINLPASLFDSYLPSFHEATNWQEALRIWLRTDSPTGRHETNLATTRQMQQHSIIRYLMTTVVFRDGDMPARTLSGDDEIFGRDLAHTELMALGTHGIFLANALYMIADRFGIPARDELELFLRGSGGDPVLLRALANALQLFWVAEYDASVHLAVVKVEAAARALLLELNEPVYRSAVGNAASGFVGLAQLLPHLLANDFDPDWERFLRTFLLGEGANIRNETAHGFAHNIDPLKAAAVLRALAVLAIITSEAAARRDTAAVKAALANPTGRRPRTWWQRIMAAATTAWYELKRG